MNQTEFQLSIRQLVSLDFVRAAKQTGESGFELDIGTNDGRSQVVSIFLNDERDHVIAWSAVGPAPRDAIVLNSLLRENLDGNYSRLAILKDLLVQVYRYPLEQLEPKEFCLALIEVASYADHYERKYYGGADNA